MLIQSVLCMNYCVDPLFVRASRPSLTQYNMQFSTTSVLHIMWRVFIISHALSCTYSRRATDDRTGGRGYLESLEPLVWYQRGHPLPLVATTPRERVQLLSNVVCPLLLPCLPVYAVKTGVAGYLARVTRLRVSVLHASLWRGCRQLWFQE